MKQMTCDICEHQVQAGDFDEWFKKMQGHYMADHAETMEEMKKTGTKEDGEKWVADNKKRWEQAEEI